MKIGGIELHTDFKPVGIADTSIGKLAVFEISAGDQDKVIGSSVEQIEPAILARRIIPYIAHRMELLGESEIKPDDPTLTEEEVNSLNDEDVEFILDRFIQSQTHLYRKSDLVPTKDGDGKTIHHITAGEVVHPKLEGENSTDYLHRLYQLREEKLNEQVTAWLKNATSFSSGIQESIQKTLQKGRSLSEQIESIRPSKIDDWRNSTAELRPLPAITEASYPTIDYEAIAKEAEEVRWAPFHAVNDRLDRLVELTATSSEFMVQMNQTQTGIATEIKSSGIDASAIGRRSLDVARWGLYATVIVLAITFIGFVLSIWDRWQGSNEATELRQQAAQFIAGQQQLSDKISSDRKASTVDILAILTEVEKNRITQQQNLQLVLDSQAELIKQHAESQRNDQRIIEELRLKVSELEAKLGDSETSAPPVGGQKNGTVP